MSMLSDFLFGKDPGQTATGRQMDGAIQDAAGGASDAESMFMKQMRGFDPAAAFQQYAQGAQGTFQKNLGTNLRDLSGKSVGQGRFNPGFFDEDQGQLVKDMSSDFTNQLNSHALDTAKMQQDQEQYMGNYSLQKGGQYLDLLSGQLDREQGQENAKKKQRGDFTNGLLQAGAMAAFL